MTIFLSDAIRNKDIENKIATPGEYLGIEKSSKSLMRVSVPPEFDDILMFNDVPSGSVIHSMDWYWNNMELGFSIFTVDIGLYAGVDFRETDGTLHKKNSVLNINAFKDEEEMFTYSTQNIGTELRFDTGTQPSTLNTARFKTWELAGLKEDPLVDFRIGVQKSLEFLPWDIFDPGYSLLVVSFSQ